MHNFRPIVLEYGVFDQVRVDKGREWYLSLSIQQQLSCVRMHQSRPPYLQTTSKMVWSVLYTHFMYYTKRYHLCDWPLWCCFLEQGTLLTLHQPPSCKTKLNLCLLSSLVCNDPSDPSGTCLGEHQRL